MRRRFFRLYYFFERRPFGLFMPFDLLDGLMFDYGFDSDVLTDMSAGGDSSSSSAVQDFCAD